MSWQNKVLRVNLTEGSSSVEPLNMDDFLAHQGFKAFQKAVEIGPQAVIDAVKDSGLRGRGGAGLPSISKNVTSLCFFSWKHLRE